MDNLSRDTSRSLLILRNKPNPVFIIDPDCDFLERIWMDPQAKTMPPVVAQSGKEAQQMFAQFRHSLSGIFINPKIADVHAMALVKAAHFKQPGVPIFFLMDEGSTNQLTYTEAELKQSGVHRTIQKPLSYATLVKLVTPACMVFDPSEAIAAAKQNADPLEHEVTVQDQSFFSARAENFLSGTQSFFDVYVRLSTGRYVKILRAGDAFSSERVVAYLKKGVTHFYLRTESQMHYVNFCDKLTSAIIKSSKVSAQVKIGQTFHQGHETISFLKQSGIDEKSIEYVSSFMTNVDQLISQLNLDRQDTLKPFLDDLSCYDHGVGVAMIASLIARELNITHEKAVHTIGLASIFHDLGLYSLPEKVQSEDLEQMSDHEKKIYRLHPITGAEVLAKTSVVDPIVLQIIEQHHERQSRNGFPKGLGAKSILQYAEIVGIADEFFRWARSQNAGASVTAQDLFDGFSREIIEAIRHVFPKILR